MKFSAIHVANAAFAAACMLFFGACAENITIVHKKEKIIERNATPSPLQYADVFHYEKTGGKADILWIVDNTEAAEVLFDKPRGSTKTRFQQGYERLAKFLTNQPGALENVDIRNQVVLSPTSSSARSPGEILTKSETMPRHLEQLFKGPQGLLIPEREARGRLAPARDYLSPTPFQSLKNVVAGTDFVPRSDARLYVIFAIASRNAEGLEKSPAEYAREISPDKPIQGVRVFNLVPKSDVECANLGSRPESFLSEQSTIGWTVSGLEGNLCAENSAVWADQIAQWIVDGQSELRLSFTPENPEAMVVYAGGRRRQYRTDYIFDRSTNSIVFDKNMAPALFSGAKVEVHYLKHSPEPLGGI